MIEKETGEIVFKDFRCAPTLQRAAFLSSPAGRTAVGVKNRGRVLGYKLDAHDARGRRFELFLTFDGERLTSCSLTPGEENFIKVVDILSAYVKFDRLWLKEQCRISDEVTVFPWGKVQRWIDPKNGYHGIHVSFDTAGPRPGKGSRTVRSARA